MIYSLAGVIGGLVAANYAAPYMMRFANLRKIHKRSARERSLVLTYDDGPGKELTPELLDLLKSFSAKATFFALGRRAIRAPDILDRILSDGHELGAHSQEHFHAWKSWPWQSTRDAAAGFRTLSRWLPPKPLFRPPYGKMTLATWLLVRARGGDIAWWTIDSGDTHEVLPQPHQIVEHVKRKGGGVVLLHDFDRSPEIMDFVLKTTELLLVAAKHEGFKCGTWSSLKG